MMTYYSADKKHVDDILHFEVSPGSWILTIPNSTVCVCVCVYVCVRMRAHF